MSTARDRFAGLAKNAAKSRRAACRLPTPFGFSTPHPKGVATTPPPSLSISVVIPPPQLARFYVVVEWPLVPLRSLRPSPRRAKPPYEMLEPPNRLRNRFSIPDFYANTHLRASFRLTRYRLKEPLAATFATPPSTEHPLSRTSSRHPRDHSKPSFGLVFVQCDSRPFFSPRLESRVA
jgi:hypothetical protein